MNVYYENAPLHMQIKVHQTCVLFYVYETPIRRVFFKFLDINASTLSE